MNAAIPRHPTSPATVLEVGERLTEAPSDRLTDIAFGRELQAQQGLVQAIGWVDLAHTMTLAERGPLRSCQLPIMETYTPIGRHGSPDAPKRSAGWASRVLGARR